MSHLLKCAACGATTPPGPSECPTCGGSLKGDGSILVRPDKAHPGVEVLKVKVVDLDIPFWQMVKLLLIISLAAIPAALVLMSALAIVTALLAAIVPGAARP